MEYISNSRSQLVINKLMDYPIVRSLWLYHPTNFRWAAWAAIICVPVSIPVYFFALRQLRILRDEMHRIIRVSNELTTLISDNSENVNDNE